MEQQRPDHTSRNYAALRGIASLCTGLGWLIVGLAGISALGSLVTMSGRNGFLLGFGGFVTSVIIGGFSFIVLRVIAESISVLLDIEFNTRQIAINTQHIPSSPTLARSGKQDSGDNGPALGELHITKADFAKLTYRQKFAVTEYGYLLSPDDAEIVGKMLGNFQGNNIPSFCSERGTKVTSFEK